MCSIFRNLNWFSTLLSISALIICKMYFGIFGTLGKKSSTRRKILKVAESSAHCEIADSNSAQSFFNDYKHFILMRGRDYLIFFAK